MFKLILTASSIFFCAGVCAAGVQQSGIRNAGLVSMSFVNIWPGSFTMGSPITEIGRWGQHENKVSVVLTKGFEIQSTEVTQLQWWEVMGTNPSHFSSERYCWDSFFEKDGVKLCPNNPVETVSWNEIQNFIAKLNSKDSIFNYRLPTEAEWEYAARAGTQTAYFFGDDSGQLRNFGWYAENSNNQTNTVGTKGSNPWGLYDMYGNVGEWVQNWYDVRSSSVQIDPAGPATGWNRVMCGGTWGDEVQFLRSAFREYSQPYLSFAGVGFRLVRTVK